VEAFSDYAAQWHFVGGYQFESLLKLEPRVEFRFNPHWSDSGAAESFFLAPLSPVCDNVILYADIVFRPSAVRRLLASETDVTIAIDTQWRERYERRTREDERRAEKVCLRDGRVSRASHDMPIEDADAEFIGMMVLKPSSLVRIEALNAQADINWRGASICDVLRQMIASGLRIGVVDFAGEWAELNAPQDLARFVFGTKADTLERLSPLVRRCVIGEIQQLTVKEWKQDPETWLRRIAGRFAGSRVAVRSSSLREDNWVSSNAGAFRSVIDVPISDSAAVKSAIDKVVASFKGRDSRDQILIHPMVQDVQVSGVAFTRSLTSGAPYFVVNYDDHSKRTDTVTSGSGRDAQMLILHRSRRTLPTQANPLLAGLIDALLELEALVAYDSLDVEFAIRGNGEIRILQVRPIAVSKAQWRISDDQVQEMIHDCRRAFHEYQDAPSFVAGARSIFGVMPDWNPAEIIGTKPRRLATSVYRYLVTDDVWATERAEAGYRDVRPCPLMVTFAGRPYIDTRASFSSFVPASVPDRLAHRLVDHYLDRLASHPQLHDKIEFEIALTCLTFDFDEKAKRLVEAGFGEEEIRQLRGGLAEVTGYAFRSVDYHSRQIEKLAERHEWFRTRPSSLSRGLNLLEDCRRYGTLPFAHLARFGFIAVSLLKSARARRLIRDEEYQAFMQSLRTVARQLGHDSLACSKGELPWEEFVTQYGHLRPGTYDVVSLNYAENAERFLRPLVERATGLQPSEDAAGFAWDPGSARRLESKLKALGLPDDIAAFDAFLRLAIEGREYSKFIFSRNLSMALEDFRLFGEAHGLSREQVSHLDLSHLQSFAHGQAPCENGRWLKRQAEEGRLLHEAMQTLELPDLIVTEDDLDGFVRSAGAPNFIGTGRILGHIADLTAGDAQRSLDGQIALIPQADPGYDWLFGQGISGLITEYGGANSHMAIRSAEFGLPAAIGVGELLYGQLQHATVVELDCNQCQIHLVS